ncbi:YbaK/EbsC family protein [Anaerolactibacter massiliensis]|jgi:prolyl-tRNA editing enzyme YbaK/EbsC (Cys-tRNA(Pro) deacylase)|uniref:YbaK/EbsC family protein n=1 Tax=Anaerolactibacter massiliensis TaxID=2044573 RepID=UPI000CFA0723|nr:YbaK/EbsC family protein [Anaerolactibacter massiliensis]MDD6367521.1 YbaK/EbsC family protein [Stecheria intestinalis]
MSSESVRKQFEEAGIADRIMTFDSSSATVELAAEDIGCAPAEICKTMAFDVDGRTILICMAGDARIANHAYKELFHKKAKMLKGDEVVARTSHPIGGVCPFGLPDDCEVYLDESLKRFEYVYPACGSANSAVKLTLPELETYSGYKAWINVTSLPE